MSKEKIIDNFNRGFIHNHYQDHYMNKYRIVQSSTMEGSIWIFGDSITNESSNILLYPKELKKFIKELKRISRKNK